MRRFDTPPGPPGWAGQGAELLRVVDPTGRAIAWLAPGFGGSGVGYAARRAEDTTGGWRQILHTGSPRELRAEPLAYGCAILGPGTDERHRAREAAWRFVERDPTAATCAARCGPAHPGDPFVVGLTLTASLEDAALRLDLSATNEGDGTLTIAPGLRLNFAAGFRAADGAAAPRRRTFRHEDGALVLTVTPGGATAARFGAAAARSCALAVPPTALPPGGRLDLAATIAVTWE